MAGLKGVIFSLRGVLVQRQFNTPLFERTVQLISFLHSRGIKTVFASNSHWVLQPSEKPFEELINERLGEQTFYYGGQNMDYKPRAKAIQDILAAEGWQHNEVVYVGNTTDDMKTANNGRVLFLNALWHGEENPYGFQFASPEDVGRFLDCLCLRLTDWFWAIEDNDLRAYALGPYSTLSARYKAAFDYSQGAKDTAKFGIDDDEFWGRLLAARVYLSGLVDEIDYVTCYPGHSITSGPPQVESALSILAGTVRKKFLPDLIQRHTTATKSQTARTANVAVDVANQLNTIKLNRKPRKGIGKEPYKNPVSLRGKTILVVDDFCTSGNSFEGARAYFQAAGAKMIGLAWLKTINSNYNAIYGGTPVADPYSATGSFSGVPTTSYPYANSIKSHMAMYDLAKTYEDYQNWAWGI
ncbi:hypothetical protein [Ruegeria sp. Alg231-54]|uniref:hypothetical protein n=1 Tax=Ruegeria sp. Alg231-54 TaxID=1922221 RepID=UPI000D55434E|nr:hypothetical protein [Ruegeria sp. Alg231-54]